MSIRIDYQTVLVIDTATPISESKMRADGGDLRVFGDAAHLEVLDFFIDPTTLNTTATRIHIKQDLPTGRYHPGIVGYYPLDGDSTDIVGPNNGVDGGIVYVTGQIGQAAEFTLNSNDNINIGSTAASIASSTGFSMECWIKTNNVIGANGSVLARKGNASTEGWVLGYAQGAGSSPPYGFNFNIGHATTRAQATSSDTFQTDVDWVHVVGTFDGSRCKLYANGVELALSLDQAAEGAIGDLGGDAFIGNRSDGGTSNAMNGAIDNFAIYQRTLTADEVRSSHLRGRAGKQLQEPTPTAAWTFNSSDNAGSEVVDLVSGLNATITGGVSVGQQGRVGQSFLFDGSTGFVSAPDDPLMEPHLGANGASTWAATINVNNLVLEQCICAKFNAQTSNREFNFVVRATTGFLRFVGQDAIGSPVSFDVFSEVPIAVGVDTHVAVVWDEATLSVKMYIDGVLVPSSLSAGTIATLPFSGVAPFTAGVRTGNSGLTDFFDGNIHDVLWSSNALTSLQIAELARRSKEGLRPDLTDTNLNLLIYWSLDNKDIGIDPQDIFGANHGTTTGVIKVGQDGQIGQAFDFPGATTASDAVTITDDATILLTGNDWTYSAWMFCRSDGEGNGGRVAEKRNSGATAGGIFAATANESNGFVSITAFWDYSSTDAAADTAVVFPINTWVMVTVVFDATTDSFEIYKDDAIVALVTDVAGSGTQTSDTGIDIIIGNTSGLTRSFDGLIDDSKLFNGTKLTSEQIADLYQKGVAAAGTLSDAKRVFVTFGDTSKTSASSAANTFVNEITGLVHAYKFDETTGSTVSDASGSDDGTVVGNVAVENGITGLARNTNCEGVIDFTSQNIPTGNASVLTRFRTTTNDQILWSNYDGYADNAGSALEITSGGVLQFRHSIGAGSDNALATGTTLVDDGQLHTVIVTKDDSNVNVYLDGYAVEATGSMTSPDIASTANYRTGGYKEVTFVAPTGLVLRLEAGSITDGYIDANGLVTDWPDLSTLENNATQVVAANRPVHFPEGVGGRASVFFQDDTWMDLTSLINLLTSDFTIFAVVQLPDNADSTSAGRAILERSSLPRGFFFIGDATSSITNEVVSILSANGATSGVGVVGITLSNDNPQLLTAGLSGATTEDIRINGTNQSLTVSSNGGLDTGASQSVAFDIIGGFDGVNLSLNAHLSAVLIFDNRLSVADTDLVERYLALKYGTPNANVTGITRAKASYDEIRVFNKVLTLSEIGDLADNYGEPSGSRAQVRKRNDPEPVLNTAL